MSDTAFMADAARPGAWEDFDDSPAEQARLRALPRTLVTAPPPSVLDIAAGVLQRMGVLDTWKLQKLVYYVQATHLARTGEPLFREPIEAWRHGPVVPALYEQHRRRRTISGLKGGDAASLAEHPSADEVIDEVVDLFGSWTGQQLRELTHRERPWQDARRGLSPEDPSNAEISWVAIRDYYRELSAVPDDPSPEEGSPG